MILTEQEIKQIISKLREETPDDSIIQDYLNKELTPDNDFLGLLDNVYFIIDHSTPYTLESDEVIEIAKEIQSLL